VNRYYYDANIKDEISEDEFQLGYERITYWYHVDENGALEFNTGLWA
jgi:hypothetical protein